MSKRNENDIDKATTSADQVDPNAFKGMTVMKALEAVGFKPTPRPRIILRQGKPREPLRRYSK